MARKTRKWSPGAIHHAVARGHCGSAIFGPDEDRAFVVERAARVFRETGATCLAWSILSNHYHVLLRCDGPPGRTFQRLNTAIAWRVSRGRGGKGAVFEDRYFSDPCADENSLLGRFAYVTANPVHHRVVATIAALRRYRWSSLGELLGDREPSWTDVSASLAMFDPDPVKARRGVMSLLEQQAQAWSEEQEVLAFAPV